MITLRVEPHLFGSLRLAFERTADDAPLDETVLDRVRTAIAEADAAALPGVSVILMLQTRDELSALQACWEVGGEGDPDVTDDRWQAINALIAQAAQSHLPERR